MKEGVIHKSRDDYYYCPRCKINSAQEGMCPCPRAGCEARIEGTIVTIKEFIKELTPKQEKWNKENHRI